MFLKATNPKDAKDEQELRQWLINNIGPEDEKIVVEFLWDKYRGSQYVDMLADLVRETGLNNREAINAIIEFGKKSPIRREAEQEILRWMAPRVHQAVLDVKGQQLSAESAFTDLCWALEEKLRNMFPHIHRATMKGAMISGFRHENGQYHLNVAHLVETLFNPDPLAMTASVSWE